jgi:hypothetical protein
MNNMSVKVPQPYLDLVNQVFEVEKKAGNIKEDNSLHRNVSKLRNLIENELFNDGRGSLGLSYHDPLGEPYNVSRTDCEANIAGVGSEDLEIVEVIKPIIFFSIQEPGHVRKVIVQKAVVVVRSRGN